MMKEKKKYSAAETYLGNCAVTKPFKPQVLILILQCRFAHYQSW